MGAPAGAHDTFPESSHLWWVANPGFGTRGATVSFPRWECPRKAGGAYHPGAIPLSTTRCNVAGRCLASQPALRAVRQGLRTESAGTVKGYPAPPGTHRTKPMLPAPAHMGDDTVGPRRLDDADTPRLREGAIRNQVRDVIAVQMTGPRTQGKRHRGAKGGRFCGMDVGPVCHQGVLPAVLRPGRVPSGSGRSRPPIAPGGSRGIPAPSKGSQAPKGRPTRVRGGRPVAPFGGSWRIVGRESRGFRPWL